MRAGRACGAEGRAKAPVPSVSWFIDDEGGYTSVAVVLALLVSVTLVFGMAASEWTMARSADVQEVADATAMAGENVVASFSTVAQVIDACVLSMGIAGMAACGFGLVASCVPALSAAGEAALEAGRQVLDSRREFAQSALAGLESLEATLPLLIVANSAACANANDEGGIGYTGCAVPLPLQSRSDYSSLTPNLDVEDIDEDAAKMRDAASRSEDARKRANDALRRGWEADCGHVPRCMRERASTLAGLTGADNPNYPSPEGWTFGVALLRARRYYAVRVTNNVPEGSDIESVTDACVRREFYRFALAQMGRGYYHEGADGTVDMMLPELPHNSAEARETTLYTDQVWPCTDEGGARTLHSTLACPGATGSPSGLASVAEVESGSVGWCPVCRMDVGDIGKVAAASTTIDNGFEHYWRQVVEASRDYQAAHNEQVAAEGEMRDLAADGAESFKAAIDQLSVPRPKLCPAGAWGCIGVVRRGQGAVVPAELTAAFLSSADLPAGIAVSAAVLAPDGATAENNVLARLFDRLSGKGLILGDGLDGLGGLWGRLLLAYGSSYESVSGSVTQFLDTVDGVFGGSVGAWLKERLSAVVDAAGFEPADMRLRKPVLTNTQNVLDKAGVTQSSTLRSLVLSIPEGGTPLEVASALGLALVNELGSGEVTIATIPIPGTDVTIPVTIDLSSLAGVT